MRKPGKRRPSRAEVEPAALELIRRHGGQILATARRYSACAEDAEDAYQRGLEILLTKAPTTREDELLPWLKTVVKHEAFALRRQRERALPTADDEGLLDHPASDAPTHERAERYERLSLGAEALRRLKPQEVRCLLLRAEGYSYRQICAETGFSYTKVNRCLTEGRRSFAELLAGIESGRECERLAPLLSALADGEADAEQIAALRPHLRACLACRATLREYRSAPARVAALVPPAAVAAGDVPGLLARFLDSVLAWTQERTAALALKMQGAAEVASAQKVAAVTASAAVMAGGGAATVHTLDGPERPRRESAPATRRAKPVRSAPVEPRVVPRPATAPARRRLRRGRSHSVSGTPTSEPAASEFEPRGGRPASEPAGSAAAGAAPAKTARPAPPPGGAEEFAP